MRPDDFAGQWIFKVAHRMGNAFAELLQTSCSDYGVSPAVTPSQWVALAWLDGEDGIPIGVLAQHLDVEASVATGIVQRLEQRHFIKRIHDDDDRRVVKIFLTAPGRELVQFLQPAVVTFHERLFQGFSPDAYGNFVTALQRLGNNLPGDDQNLSSLLSRETHRGKQA